MLLECLARLVEISIRSYITVKELCAEQLSFIVKSGMGTKQIIGMGSQKSVCLTCQAALHQLVLIDILQEPDVRNV